MVQNGNRCINGTGSDSEKHATEDEIRSFEADGIYPNNDFIR